jgi:hypothetical protein
MFEAAVGTHQLGGSVVDDAADGLAAGCQRGDVDLFYGTFAVSNQDPCGEYRVQTRATAHGAQVVLTTYLDVICFQYVQVDFAQVDWGVVTPGSPSVLLGDLTFGGPGNRPTLRNGGNDGLGVAISFAPAVRMDAAGHAIPGGGEIAEFGACLGRSATTLQCIDRIGAGQVSFDGQRERVLCANETGRLDLYAYPPPGLTDGRYVGSVSVMGRSVPNVC